MRNGKNNQYELSNILFQIEDIFSALLSKIKIFQKDQNLNDFYYNVECWNYETFDLLCYCRALRDLLNENQKSIIEDRSSEIKFVDDWND